MQFTGMREAAQQRTGMERLGGQGEAGRALDALITSRARGPPLLSLSLVFCLHPPELQTVQRRSREEEENSPIAAVLSSESRCSPPHAGLRRFIPGSLPVRTSSARGAPLPCLHGQS